MKKDILKKGIVLPLIIGIVLSVAFFIFLRSTATFYPLEKGTAIANHDAVSVESNMVDKADLSACKANDNIGTITVGDESYVVRYNCDYSNMISSISFVDGVAFGDGVAYLETTSKIAERVLNSGDVTYNGTFGEHNYTYIASKEYDGKYKLISEASNLMDENNGFILIYQAKENGGLSSKYTALIYEEVA